MSEIVKSFSKCMTYMSCPYQYHLKYVIGLQPKEKSRALTVGSAIHKVVEGIELEDIKLSSEHDFDLNKFKEFYEKNSTIKRDYDVVETEIKVTNEDESYIGYVDKVLRNKKTGNLYVYECKSFSVKPDESARVFSSQTYNYLHLLKQNGYDCVGVVYEYIRSELPKVPTLLKNGAISTSESTLSKVTTDSLLEACELHNIDKKDVKLQLAIVKNNLDNFIYTTIRYVSEKVSENVYNEIMQLDINENCKTKSMQPMKCKMCQYKTICELELHGADASYLIEENYNKREK